MAVGAYCRTVVIRSPIGPIGSRLLDFLLPFLSPGVMLSKALGRCFCRRDCEQLSRAARTPTDKGINMNTKVNRKKPAYHRDTTKLNVQRASSVY